MVHLSTNNALADSMNIQMLSDSWTHRFPEGKKNLSPYYMEIVGGIWTVYNNPVAVIQLTHRKVISDFLQPK